MAPDDPRPGTVKLVTTPSDEGPLAQFMTPSPEEEDLSGEGGALPTRRRWVTVSVVAMMALVVVGLGAAALIKSPAQRAADAAAPPEDVLTAPVELRVLKETVVMRGTVATSQSATVGASAIGAQDAARMIVTRAPMTTGRTVRAGKVVLEVSGRPIVAMRGQVPMYRDLRPDARGRDVAQLQRALDSLGFGVGLDARGHFGSGTKAAVANFYASIGYDPVPAQEGGDDVLSSAEDAVLQMERAVQDASKGKAKTRAREDLAKAQQDLAETRAVSGPMVPASEVVFLKSFPARVASVGVSLGDELTGTGMTISSGDLIVTSALQPAQKALLRKGMRVEILSEATGKTYQARIGSVADSPPVSQGDGSADAEADQPAAAPDRYTMTVVPDEELPSSSYGQEVRLTVEAASTKGEALVVPVTAISAGADAKTIVRVVGADQKQRKVEVLTGTTGDGFIEVVPVGSAALAEGDRVVTGLASSEGDSQDGP